MSSLVPRSGGCARSPAANRGYARDLLAALGPDMLLLADREFAAIELITGIHRTGAELPMRVTAGRRVTA